ncbi:MAG: RyR domain-containing protein [Bacteroidales bacterium]
MKPSKEVCDEIRCERLDLFSSPWRCGVSGKVPGHMDSCPINRINSYEELVEEIARYEHLQWVEWSKAIAESETISPERLARWKKQLWVPYSRLPEEQKESDRKYARKVLKHLMKAGFIHSYVVSGKTRDEEERKIHSILDREGVNAGRVVEEE